MMTDDQMNALLRDEVNVPSGDNERINWSITRAKEYVQKAVGNQTVSDSVFADCVISCAADLYNMREARLGVMDAADGDLQPYRISTDPLRSVWPKLKAAGILTGGTVIA